MEEYSKYDGLGLAELIRRKDVKPEELLDEAIRRTEKIDSQNNAVVIKHHDFAKRQIAGGLPKGPFTGVPFFAEGHHCPGGNAKHVWLECLS